MLDDDGVRELLTTSRRIAVIGASDRPGSALVRCLPPPGGAWATTACRSTPRSATSLGIAAFPTLADASTRRDRSTSSTSSGGRSCVRIRTRARPPPSGRACLWLQLGIVDWEAARIAHDGGLNVVMDRCLSVEWRRLGSPGLQGGSMTQIHLHAEPGDYAPVVLLPGDPNRATRIAARFDGGLDGDPARERQPGTARLHGQRRRGPVSVQTTMMGAPTTTIVMEELLNLGVTTFIRVGTCGGFGASRSATSSSRWPPRHGAGIGTDPRRGGEPTAPTADFDVVEALAGAEPSAGTDDPRRSDRHVRRVLRPPSRWRHPLGRRGYLAAEMETAAGSTCSRCASGQGPRRPCRDDPHRVDVICGTRPRWTARGSSATRTGTGRPRTRSSGAST